MKKINNLNNGLGMSLILAGSLGMAMSLPVYAFAEDGKDDGVTLAPRDGEPDGNTISNLYDAQRDGFLPYDNNATEEDGQDNQDDFSDDPNELDGADDFTVHTPGFIDEDGDGVPDGEGDDQEQSEGGLQVGDTVYDDEGNAWVITARPDDGSDEGEAVNNLADALRLGFQAVPEDEWDGGEPIDPNDPEDTEIPSSKEMTVFIQFNGDEGHEDARPSSVVVNVYDGDGALFFTTTVEIDAEADEWGNWGGIEVPGGIDPFTVSVEPVDHYDAEDYSYLGGKKIDLTMVLAYRDDEPVVDDEEEQVDEQEDDQTEEQEETTPTAATATPAQPVAPARFTPADLPQTGDEIDVMAVVSTVAASVVSFVGAFIAKKVGA